MLQYMIVMMMLLATSAYADKWPSATEIISRMKTELNLNPDQVARAKVIIEDNIQKRVSIKPESNLGLTQAQSQPLDAALYHDLSEVLTSSQMKDWNMLLTKMLRESDSTHGGI